MLQIAVDNYPALYCATEYGEWTTQHKRRVIQPEELRVAAAMRVLELEDPTDGVYLCASTRTGDYSNKLRVSFGAAPPPSTPPSSQMGKAWKPVGTFAPPTSLPTYIPPPTSYPNDAHKFFILSRQMPTILASVTYNVSGRVYPPVPSYRPIGETLPQW